MNELYEELKSRKDNGERLSIADLDLAMLKKLWWDEAVPDSLIAKLYDVRKEDITKLRYKYGLKQQVCLMLDAY